MSNKPTLFVGSSKESLRLAHAIHRRLRDFAEVTVWDQGAFRTNRANLENLLKLVDKFDYAMFVWLPDDILKMRQEVYEAVRDNLIFEFGLFLGKLGRDRVFAVIPADEPNLHILSDLRGVTLLEYENDRNDKNHEAAVSIACEDVRLELEAFAQEMNGTSLTPQQILAKIESGFDQIMSRSLNTVYIGVFPSFLSRNILPCLEAAREQIYIACDYATYGSFSDYQSFNRYKQLLEEKYNNKVRVNILVLDEAAGEERTFRQFGRSEEEWRSLHQDPIFTRHLNDFKSRTGVRPNTLRQFCDELHRLENSCIADFQEKMPNALREINASMPIYLWIADNNRAVFSISKSGRYSEEHGSEEHGFETKDPDLIKAIRYIWESYSKPVKPMVDETRNQQPDNRGTPG